MLRAIDAVADFDIDEIYARIQSFIENPLDDVEEVFLEPFRVVSVLDQGCLFDEMAA
ncbi:hypothetical protein [Granulicella arctica]|uniref:Uncharacterized protein n=1 Tax=Granulicella arctica TaxID=940613 RepID=A0A7Y9PKB2_9BACT|nr:hypothetical protein [Granulicella arctica]NYF81315.1 hypothetical protein [Granulicella arctica]